MSDKNANRKWLGKKIHETVGFSKVISENIVKDIFYIIETAFKNNDKIKIYSFGTFFKKRNVMTFKASKFFKNKVNL